MATFYNFHPAWSAGPSPTPGGSRRRQGARGPVLGRRRRPAPPQLRGPGPTPGRRRPRPPPSPARPCRTRTAPAAPCSPPTPPSDGPRSPHSGSRGTAPPCTAVPRSDGHVASLLTDGVGGGEAHVLAAAAGQRLPGSLLREYRGWSDEEWAEAAAGLRSRGWLEADGALTEAGRAARDARERRTDDLAT